MRRTGSIQLVIDGDVLLVARAVMRRSNDHTSVGGWCGEVPKSGVRAKENPGRFIVAGRVEDKAVSVDRGQPDDAL